MEAVMIAGAGLYGVTRCATRAAAGAWAMSRSRWPTAGARIDGPAWCVREALHEKRAIVNEDRSCGEGAIFPTSIGSVAHHRRPAHGPRGIAATAHASSCAVHNGQGFASVKSRGDVAQDGRGASATWRSRNRKPRAKYESPAGELTVKVSARARSSPMARREERGSRVLNITPVRGTRFVWVVRGSRYDVFEVTPRGRR